jgi:hypothetical protein
VLMGHLWPGPTKVGRPLGLVARLPELGIGEARLPMLGVGAWPILARASGKVGRGSAEGVHGGEVDQFEATGMSGSPE